MLPTLAELQHALDQGDVTSESLVQAALDRITAPDGEGARAFTQVYAEQALAAARAADGLRRAGLRRSPIDGLPVSVKDLFDIRGVATTAGSVVLKDAPAATANAAIVERLIAAGAVIVGRTNMTEFAFSGLGLNPHYGTPSSPWDRATGRIPGGSSSGAGVSVADGMCAAAIGTDTGGSVRIPSAFCGLTGFKPTASRISMAGTLPLSPSLDSIGPLAASVQCCITLDAVLSGQPLTDTPVPALSNLRLGVPDRLVLDGADDHVRQTFAAAIDTLTRAGAQIQTISLPEFDTLAHINRKGGFTCSEAWHWHQHLLTQHPEAYDPRVSSRMLRGKDMTASDYLDMLRDRPAWIAAVTQRLAHVDGLLMPTVPVTAPAIADLQASDEAYFAANGLILRNPTLINFLDGCALSLPCHAQGQAPVGLMLASTHGKDRQVLAMGLAIEQALAR